MMNHSHESKQNEIDFVILSAPANKINLAGELVKQK